MVGFSRNMKMYCSSAVLVLAAVFAFCQEPLPQKKEINYNVYYQFPFSIDLGFQNLRPMAGQINNLEGEYSINDIAPVMAHYPIPSFPSLQPFIQGGIIRFDRPVLRCGHRANRCLLPRTGSDRQRRQQYRD